MIFKNKMLISVQFGYVLIMLLEHNYLFPEGLKITHNAFHSRKPAHLHQSHKFKLVQELGWCMREEWNEAGTRVAVKTGKSVPCPKVPKFQNLIRQFQLDPSLNPTPRPSVCNLSCISLIFSHQDLLPGRETNPIWATSMSCQTSAVLSAFPHPAGWVVQPLV